MLIVMHSVTTEGKKRQKTQKKKLDKIKIVMQEKNHRISQ